MENKKRILVVDDEFLLREQIEGTFNHLLPDCEVVKCGTKDEALQALQEAAATNRPFSVVSTDFHLTSDRIGEGAMIAQAVKSEWPHIPVIVVSAEIDTDRKNVESQCGADAYLMKPFVSAQFAVALGEAMEHRKLAHAA